MKYIENIFTLTVLVVFLPIGVDAKPDAKKILIPGGEYSVGSLYCEEEQGNADWCNDEIPRKVKLDTFWVDKYEVSNDDYRECFIAGVCEPSLFHEDRPQDFNKPLQPVVFVSWENARTYCEWRGEMLPTEIQWEVAAEGERLGGAHFGQPYGKGRPEIIGEFEANSHGLYDMMGNVYEWTLSEFSRDGKNKVVRGGAWNSAGHFLRTSDRVGKDPILRYSDVGFRCVKSTQSKAQ
jgi:formylglycine-generating enzyme required for sulfatase activity